MSKLILRGKLGMANPRNQARLPVFGHVALQVHGGTKVFDLDRMEVTKVFAADVPAHVRQKEIDSSRVSSKIAAAPGFLGADPGQDWYREEFIHGEHATGVVRADPDRITKFYPDVEQCLTDLVGLSEPTLIETRSHIDRNINRSFQARWQESGLDQDTIEMTTAYVGQLGDWLRSRSTPETLQLVMTHGDFSLVNAIWTDHGLRFIDWEGIAPGGIYSDILNFLYVEYYYGRAPSNFLDHISIFVQQYLSSIHWRYPNLVQATDLDPEYARRLYYLERLNWLLNRSASENLAQVVKKSIEMFNAVDREFGETLA
jgi:hypothetical protein